MTHFSIIGIRPLMPSFADEQPVYAHKAQAIQKALWGKDKWMYFYSGYTVAEDNSSVDVTLDALRDFSLYDTDNLKVSVCAIVGKNGSGKSSTVDLLIRMINNLSAVLLGEKFNFAAAEHLHFIDHVYAELAFRIGNAIYILEERGRRIVLHKYMRNRKSGYSFVLVNSEILLSEETNAETTSTLLKKHKKGRVILKSLYYTLVCNYSLYGFNYLDYYEEATPLARLKKLYPKKADFEKLDDDDQYWLKGIFHKNDGYQTPIVLHPMREYGRLNVNKENLLAKERMCNLLFYKDAMGKYPQRIINGNLSIVALHISPAEDRKFAKDRMLYRIGIRRSYNVAQEFDKVYDWILDFWDEKYNFKVCNQEGKLFEDACNYIVYKTLKIICNYRKYRPVFNYLSKKAAQFDEFREKLNPLSVDFTHITKKLLRTIMYLKKDIYLSPENHYNLAALDASISQYVGEEIHPKYRLQEVDLLPPPIFDVTLQLTKVGQNGTIDFRNLSSGERQIAYTISNFMYHLVNVDSEWNDYYKDFAHMEVIKYRYVNVIFDEVELYFHPELQRRFMGLLFQALQNAHFRNLRGINIMLATHSPFILSDIPETNVLCLGEDDTRVTGTFGGNIMKMLSSGFFMDRSIGEVVRNEIVCIAEFHKQIVEEGLNEKQAYLSKKKRIDYVASHIGDDFLKDIVVRMINEIEHKLESL